MPLPGQQAWNNLVVPEDGVTGQGDAGSEPEESADEVLESENATPKASSGQASTANEPQDDAEAPANRMLAHQRALDPEDNTRTRPTDGEHVTFRSLTLADVYIGPQADALTETFRSIKWIHVDEPFANEIAKARQEDTTYNTQFLLMSGPTSHPWMYGFGEERLPAGIQRIVGQLYVLGPSMVALVLTFVLADSEARCLDNALREDMQSQLHRSASGMVGVRTVFQLKYEGVRALLDKFGDRCLEWLEGWAPGTLCAGEGTDVPVCSLVSLARGKPFQDQGDYMRLLGLTSGYGAARFASPDFMFLVPRTGRLRPREFIAAFNEADASQSSLDLSVAPEILHQSISPYMAVLALEGLVRSLESRMRGTRSGLAELDPGKGMESQVLALRTRLLKLSRDIAVISGDIKGVIEDDTFTSLWADYPALVPVDHSQPSPPPARPSGEIPRKKISEYIANLKEQEGELRELVLVTSQAVSDAQNAKTQKTLNRLTWVLVVLTIFVLAATIVPLVRSSSDGGRSPGGATRARPPAPAHSRTRPSSPSRTVPPKRTHQTAHRAPATKIVAL